MIPIPKKRKFLAGGNPLRGSGTFFSSTSWALRLGGPDALPEGHQRRCTLRSHGKGQSAHAGAKTTGFLEKLYLDIHVYIYIILCIQNYIDARFEMGFNLSA